MSASVMVVLDFDGTITKADTTILSFMSKQSYIHGTDSQKRLLMNLWEEISLNYFNGYNKIIEIILKNKDHCSFTHLELLMKDLDAYCLKSRKELAQKKIFADIDLNYANEAVKSIQFHNNAKETLYHFKQDQSIACKVLSVNWFPELLYEALIDFISKENIVTSNVPKWDDGENFGQVSTSFGKGEWVKEWTNESHLKVIYLGDSITDIFALLNAEYGILFGANDKTKEIINHFKIPLIPLSQFNKQNNKDNVVYFTNCWREVKYFVSRLLCQ